MLPNKSYPKVTFVKNGLNTININGKKLHFIESDVFDQVDKMMSKSLKNIRNAQNDSNYNITVEDKLSFAWGLCHLFWRIPNSNNNYLELLNKDGINTDYFRFENSYGEQLTEKEYEILQKIQNNKEIQKAFKLLYPLASFFSGETIKMVVNWHTYNIKSNKVPLITGDNPFVRKSKYSSIDNIIGEFIFPLATNQLLIVAKESPKFIDNVLVQGINLATLHQSERFVCCGNKEYLLNLVKIYKELCQSGNEKNIINDVFTIFKKLSRSRSFDKYVLNFT